MNEKIAKLHATLQVFGPRTAKELAEHLRLSQASISRLIDADTANILRLGQRRSQKYVLKKKCPDGAEKIPLYTIDEKGRVHHRYDLHPFAPKGFYLENLQNHAASQIFSDLPYFLDDLRPSGFLGQLIPSQYPEFNFPKQIQNWSWENSYTYWTNLGWNLMGNLIIGNKALQNYLDTLRQPTPLPKNNRIKKFEAIIQNLLKQAPAGSSAAGEQPKFLISDFLNGHHLFIKFSPPIKTAVGRRRADLLIAEHIVHKILSQYCATPQSRILISETHVFLEMSRFDRVDKLGRKAVISLQALDNEFVGLGEGWDLVAQELLKQKRINQKIYQQIIFLETFGQLIANSDRHLGNISFFHDDFQIKSLTPVYDMLPMLYAPFHEQIILRDFDPPAPNADSLVIWQTALTAAKRFWQEVAKDGLISKPFQKIAKENFLKLKNLEKTYGDLTFH